MKHVFFTSIMFFHFVQAAVAAGLLGVDAFCRDRYKGGQFSTWGRYWQTGKSAVENLSDNCHGYRIRYNANAYADWTLYKLIIYVCSLKEGK